MTLESLTTNAATTVVPESVERWVDHFDKKSIQNVASLIGRFLDVGTTVTGKATAYNKKSSQDDLAETMHKEMFDLDRGLYGLLVGFEGATDLSKQTAVSTLLDNPRMMERGYLLNPEQESKLITHLVTHLPDSRMFKLYGKFVKGEINNARSRKLILRSLLHQSVNDLETWAVEYREKMRVALEHALGRRNASIIGKILGRTRKIDKMAEHERKFISAQLVRFIHEKTIDANVIKAKLECIAFVLGVEAGLTLPKFVEYRRIKLGVWPEKSLLPLRTLQGLASGYHKGRTKAEILELTKENLRQTERVQVQKQAEKVGVEVKFNPNTQDAVKLYIYAYEQGLTDEITDALDQKARRAAATFPTKFEHVGVILDTSSSMRGSKEQPLRPMAVALSVRDMLVASAKKSTVVLTDTEDGSRDNVRLPRPKDSTGLARPLISLFEKNVDAVFVISDGYENSPAGRFAEVLKKAREIGIETPVYQLTPVAGAEAFGCRTLAPGLVESLPVSSAASLGSTLLKAMLSTDPRQGVKAIVGMAMKQLTVTVGGK